MARAAPKVGRGFFCLSMRPGQRRVNSGLPRGTLPPPRYIAINTLARFSSQSLESKIVTGKVLIVDGLGLRASLSAGLVTAGAGSSMG